MHRPLVRSGIVSCYWLCFLLHLTHARVLDFLNDFDSVPFDDSREACAQNSAVLGEILNWNCSNNTLVFPENYTFNFHHGISARNIQNSVIQVDGILRFQKVDLPMDHFEEGDYPACITIGSSQNITVTSKNMHRGLIDGRGSQYWGWPLIGYVQIEEQRPRLLLFNLTKNILIENLILQDSPYHTLYLDAVDQVEVRHVSIINRRTYHDGHSFVDLTAFNTDGIDCSGSNVWVHDCDIFVQDDCIAVKDVKNHSLQEGVDGPYVTTNMTFERLNASGLGFVVGAIRNTQVKNITFRDSYLHKTVKGIYLKFAEPNQENYSGSMEDILYENITMESPSQWPIWVGPAQQADTSDFCHPNPCSLCWPVSPGAKCHSVKTNEFRNITLRSIRINNPQMSPGVIIGSRVLPIDGLVFQDVLVTHGLPLPIARLNRHDTFPGTRQEIHDAYVPKVITIAQKAIQGIQDFLSPIILQFREALAKSCGGYTNAALNLVQNGGGAEQWYLSIILQEILGDIWIWLLLSLFTAILAFCVVRHWNRYTSFSGGEAANQRLFYHSLYAVLFLIFVLAAMFCLAAPFRKPKWQRTDEYYRCRGVANGVALGSTWPVPKCFRDQSNWTIDTNSTDSSQDLDNDSSLVDSTIVLMCVTLIIVMFSYRQLSIQEERLRVLNFPIRQSSTEDYAAIQSA